MIFKGDTSVFVFFVCAFLSFAYYLVNLNINGQLVTSNKMKEFEANKLYFSTCVFISAQEKKAKL